MLRLLSGYFWPIAGATLLAVVLLAAWVGRLIQGARIAAREDSLEVPEPDASPSDSGDDPAPEPADEPAVDSAEDSPYAPPPTAPPPYAPPDDSAEDPAPEPADEPQVGDALLNGFDQLRSPASEKDPRPWFLLLGQVGSRPKGFLASANLSAARSRPDHDDPASERGVRWRFFDGGLVLDLAGEYILRSDGESSDEVGWWSFVGLLQRERPKRPLDGVVLTLSATDLLSAPTRTSSQGAEIGRTATALARKLGDLQRILGIRFPVYILITDCDHIRGFSSFAKAIPESARQDIFGWSSPHDVDTACRPEWADEAFEELKRDLERRQLRILAQGFGPDFTDEVFVFSTEVHGLRAAVKSYLNQLLWCLEDDSLLLRGIYLCGSAGIEAADPESKTGEEVTRPVEMPDVPQDPAQGYLFVSDLFEQKIFAEADLARPTAASLLRRRRRVRTARLGLAAIVALLTMGLWTGARELQQRGSELQRFLGDAREGALTAERVRARYPGTSLPTSEREALKRNATVFLNRLAALDTSRLASPFIPVSWPSKLDERLERAFVHAYKLTVFRALGEELAHRAERAVSQGPIDFDPEIVPGAAIPESTSPASVEPVVPTDSSNLRELEHHIELYNKLKVTRSLEDLAVLVESLLGEPVPAGFFTDPHIHRAALERIEYADVSLSDYRD